jgi:hypothetical protein
MTNTVSLDPVLGLHPSHRSVRIVLATNAATTAGVGAAGVIGASWWADELGLGNTAAVAVVGAALVLFAGAVAVLGRLPDHRIGVVALATSAVDLAWVVGTVVVAATADLTMLGRLVAAVLGLGVLAFALLQIGLRPRRDLVE